MSVMGILGFADDYTRPSHLLFLPFQRVYHLLFYNSTQWICHYYLAASRHTIGPLRCACICTRSGCKAVRYGLVDFMSATFLHLGSSWTWWLLIIRWCRSQISSFIWAHYVILFIWAINTKLYTFGTQPEQTAALLFNPLISISIK